jgi:flavin-dependent dehydrogenase
MGWWKGVVLEQPDVGVMIWDRRLDGYYAWAFPEPGGVTNIGLTIPEGARQASRLKDLFSDLLADHFSVEMENAEQVGKWMGHPATLTTKVGEIAEAHALWIGEAARLVSPATVEGIAFAMESGTIAADLIGRYFPSDGRGFKPWHLGMYRAKIGAAMLPKFWAAEGFARLMRSDRALDWTTRLLNPQWLAARAASVAGGAGIRPSDSVARA